MIHIKPNPTVYRSLAKEAFVRLGDTEWQHHIGLFTIVPKIAVKFGVPLIIWGESPQIEYGGPATSKKNYNLDRKWLEEFGGLLGNRIGDMLTIDGLTDKDLSLYTYPNDSDITRSIAC